MKYMGSKARVAKHILPIMLEGREDDQHWVEPFVGGANMIDKVTGPRVAGDANPYLIAYLDSLSQGWVPPDIVTEADYNEYKTNPDRYDPALVAYVAFGLSFGAKWFGGYARRERGTKDQLYNMIRQSRVTKNSALKQAPLLAGVRFHSCGYNRLPIAPNSIIYCDPPYRGTTGYMSGDFDHDAFWQWCRDRSEEGHIVYVSEYTAPDDFISIWSHDLRCTINANDGERIGTERLFVPSL